MVEGNTTRSPARKLRTSSPTSSTMPTPSWPRIVPGFIPETVPRTKCRSVPSDGTGGEPHDGVGGFFGFWFGNVVEPNVTDAVEDDRFHETSFLAATTYFDGGENESETAAENLKT